MVSEILQRFISILMAFLFSITITRSTVLRVTPYLLTSLKLYSNTLGTVVASKVQLKTKRLPSVLAVTLDLMVCKLYFWLSKLHVLLCLPHLPVFGQRYLHEYKVGNMCTSSTPSNLRSEERFRRRMERASGSTSWNWHINKFWGQ